MTTLELVLNLPDDLVGQARAAGLLSSEAIEKLLREQLRRQAGEELRVMFANAPDDEAPMSEDEVQAEIDAYRAERRERRNLNP
jgi:hypothetical protein